MQISDKLSSERLQSYLDHAVKKQIQEIIVLAEVGSTNDYLLKQAAPDSGCAIVCVAEHQTMGRGRQGRVWHSKPSSSFIYSCAWSYTSMPKDLTALTLAIGVVVQTVLTRQSYTGIQLKWPNDLLVGQAKLGGILLETKQQSGALHLVCGIGINIKKNQDEAQVERPIISLDELSSGLSCDRNFLAAQITNGLTELLSNYPQTGFSPWQAAWQELHCMQDCQVKVISPDGIVEGTARGVDDQGAFLLQTDAEIIKFISAEVSVRQNLA